MSICIVIHLQEQIYIHFHVYIAIQLISNNNSNNNNIFFKKEQNKKKKKKKKIKIRILETRFQGYLCRIVVILPKKTKLEIHIQKTNNLPLISLVS